MPTYLVDLVFENILYPALTFIFHLLSAKLKNNNDEKKQAKEIIHFNVILFFFCDVYYYDIHIHTLQLCENVPNIANEMIFHWFYVELYTEKI